MSRGPVLVLAATAAIAGASCRGAQEPHRPAAANEQATSRLAFAIDGRVNEAPSVAALGKTVAVVWTARTEEAADIYVSVSTDSGATFAFPSRVNDIDGDARASGEQPARVAVGQGHAIHVVWPARRDGRSEIRYAGSTDGGKSFSKAATIAGGREPGLRGWHSLAIGYDGGVHVLWLDGRNAAPRPSGGRHQHGGHKPGVASTGGGTSPRQDVFHAAWKGSGARTEAPVADHVCFCCKTAIATAGEHVYAAWRHIYPGSLRDIAVARSDDNGATFGTPIRLSEDGWKIEACPDDGPAMAADTHGGIHIAWPTLVPGDPPRKGIFYASLPEGAAPGQAFTPRVRLDSGTGDPAHPQLASDDHGNSAIVWDERVEDRRRIVLRRVTAGAAGAPEVFEGAGVSYPAVAAADGHWVTVWAAQGNGGRSVIEGRQLPFAAHR